jgi:6-phosphofructokinase 1
VVGFRDGFEGLLPPGHHAILDRQAVNGIMALGGTILGATNRGHFVAKIGAGDRTIVPAKIIADARNGIPRLRSESHAATMKIILAYSGRLDASIILCWLMHHPR